ncbi:MAG: secretin N-terminal domain-containing protein, partial [Anaerolineae bacterium]
MELQDVGPTVATVLIKSDKPIPNYEYFALPDPPRLVIAIHEAIHAVPKRVETLTGGPIKNIRSFQYRRRPVQIVRVVLHLSSNLPYLPHIPSRIQAAPGALQIVIGEAGTRTATTAEAPNAHVASPEAPAPDNSVPPPGLSKKVSVDLRQMDTRAVIKFLAEQGDLNIVPGKNVGGRVTLSLKNITIQDALDIIASTHGLAYVLQSPVIHVMTEADYQLLFGSSFADQRQVKRVQLRYADAAALAAVLGNMKSQIGRVIADAQTRTIILIDVPEKLEQMVAAAESMDRATQLQTEVFELEYAKAEDVKAEVEKVLTPKLGAMRLDKRTNTLVVTDLLLQMPEVRRVIHAFDRRPREVIIETKIIELRL